MVVAQAEINFHSILPDFEFLGILAQLTRKRPAAISYFISNEGTNVISFLRLENLSHTLWLEPP